MPRQTLPTVTLIEAARAARVTLASALHAYEATGDHDHGRGPITFGKPCPGGDCIAFKVRQALDAIVSVDPSMIR